MPKPRTLESDLARALSRSLPQAPRLLEAAGGRALYLVGGAVRDLLLGLPLADVDLLSEEDPGPIAAVLGEEVVEHPRFGTASLVVDGLRVDLARARSETYPRPGALPEVTPAGLEDDLARRDFTINAMAMPLRGDPVLIDPHGGRGDLGAGLLRVLHERSFLDDPTRALRAARYAARFGLELEPRTAALITAADLGSVSDDRRQAELRRIAEEPTAPAAFALLGEWGLMEPREGGLELAERVSNLLAAPPWSEEAPRTEAVLAAAFGPLGRATELAEARPSAPSAAVEVASAAGGAELVLARALGAEWLEDYVSRWRGIRLEIGGDELIAAGIPPGPAIGRGLAGALRRKLDGELSGREAELEAALEAARDAGG